MFKAFEFQVTTRVKCGANLVDGLGKEVLTLGGKKVLVVTDQGIVKAGLLGRVTVALEGEGLIFEVYDRVEANPRVETIDNGYEFYREVGADVIVGFGGGSSMDTAKGIGLLATNGGSMAQYAGQNKVQNQPAPVIAIPTTAGTGSEVTGNIAFTDLIKKDKMSSRSPLNFTSVAILDHTLLSSLPASIAAATGMDALIHAVEGYLSKKASPMSDVLALEATRMIGSNIRKFVANPENEEAAASMLLASALAGMVITNTGTGNVHGMARPVGGQFDVPHGVACAIMFAPVMRFNLISSPEKMAKVAEALGEKVDGLPLLEAGFKAVDAVEKLVADLGIPKSMSAFGVNREAVPTLARLSLANTGPNPRRTSYDDLVALFNEAI